MPDKNVHRVHLDSILYANTRQEPESHANNIRSMNSMSLIVFLVLVSKLGMLINHINQVVIYTQFHKTLDLSL